MAVLRFVTLAVLAVWVGGLVVLGAIAAPSIFDVIGAHDPVAGSQLAGSVFGVIFERFTRMTFALGAVLAFTLASRAALGARPRLLLTRVSIIGVMVALAGVTAFIVAPRIDALRVAVAVPIASLPDTDPRRQSFGRLHGLSSGLALVTVLLGAGLLWLESTDHGEAGRLSREQLPS